jgi:hypothetical protein
MATSVTTEREKTTVYTDTALGLRYVVGPTKVLFSNGVLIMREDYDAWKKNGTIVEQMETLKDDPEYNNYDFQYAVSTGVPRRKKNTADLVASARAEVIRKKQLDAALSTVEHIPELAATTKPLPTQAKNLFAKYLSSSFLLSVVMIIIGIGSAVMSAYHTTSFLWTGGKPFWTAIMTGTMLILFSGTAFTAARHFISDGGFSIFIGLLFLIAGMGVIVYSMFSTLTVNYNQFKSEAQKESVINITNNESLAAHEKLLEQNALALNEATREIEQLENEADYWREKSWRRYDEFESAITAARTKRDTLREERGILEASKPELVEQAAVSEDTVYTFLADIFRIKEDTARFFVYCMPALLYDILAPFTLTVVLLLVDKRRRGEGNGTEKTI